MNVAGRLKWGALLVVAVLAAYLGGSALRAAGQARAALAVLDRMQATAAASPGAAALPALRADVAELEVRLVAARASARPFLWLAPAFGWVPRAGPLLAAAPELADLGVELAGSGRLALDVLAPVLEALNSPEGGDRMAAAVGALNAAAPGLTPAAEALARARALRDRLPPGLHPKLDAMFARLDPLLPLAGDGLRLAAALPALLGAGGERTYLILAQNNHELRATGGFISGAGIVRFNGGAIADLRLTDSYAVDNFNVPHPLPPRALQEQMGAGMLLLRDGNWDPDFPTTAETTMALYLQDQGVATDGAIAIDLEAVRLIVQALGPLQIPGYPDPVTGDNVIEAMKRSWEAPATSADTVQDAASSDWWSRRKDFMADLLGAALGRVDGGGDLDLAALAGAGLAMLQGRHLQIYVADPEIAPLLAQQGWDGALAPRAGADFLAVIDSNVGFNKANAAVQPAIEYQVVPEGAGLLANLTLTYRHTAPPLPVDEVCDRLPRYGESYDELIGRCYWDYLRVYTPAGTELVSAEGLRAASTEPGAANTTIFTGDFVLRPGSEQTIRLRYRLPPSLASDRYAVFVRKQAGTEDIPIEVDAGGCTWVTSLAHDRTLRCSDGKAELSP